MSIAVLSHHDRPAIAVLRRRAAATGHDLVVYDAHLGRLPEQQAHDGWVVLGGARSAHADRADFADEIDALRSAVAAEVPVLAICLGAQLLAEALGGRAIPGRHGLEAGVIEVRSTQEQPPTGRYLSFHSDSMEPPAQAQVLATSDRYVQSWALGSALAVQFHPELDAAGFGAVLDAEEEKLTRFGVDVPALRREVAAHVTDSGDTPTPAERLLDTWLGGLPRRPQQPSAQRAGVPRQPATRC